LLPAPSIGLHDRREAAALDRRPGLLLAARAAVPRHAQAGLLDRLLHRFLVAEDRRLRARHARHAERLAQPRRQVHQPFPQALDAVDRAAAQPRAHLVDPISPPPCRILTWATPRSSL
jgi:hypothetical protein